MADLDQLRKRAKNDDMDAIIELFREAKRLGLPKDMRDCVDKWHRATQELQREASSKGEGEQGGLGDRVWGVVPGNVRHRGNLFSYFVEAQGYGGEIWEILVNNLFSGFGISWSYRTLKTTFGLHPSRFLPLILSQILVLGKDGECYPGPMFPNLIGPREILELKSGPVERRKQK